MGFDITTSNRVTGLASGLDTETMVRDLMKAESIRLDRLEQQRTLLKWKQDGYREVTDLLFDFKSKWLDFTTAGSNMLASSAYNACQASSSNSSILTATAGGGAREGLVTLTNGLMATAAKAQGSVGLTSELTGSIDLNSIGTLSLSGKALSVSVDGVTRDISFSSDYANAGDFITDFQSKLDAAFGEGRITAQLTAGGYLNLSDINSTIAVGVPSSGTEALTDLGLTDGQSHRIDVNATLSSLTATLGLTFDGDDKLTFMINGESFSFDSTSTVKSMMDTINQSDADVTMRYDALSDGFSIVSNDTGSGQSVNVANLTGNLFGGSSVIGIDNGTWYGANAELVVDGQLLSSSDNNLQLDGVTYTLSQDFSVGQSETVTVLADNEQVIEDIKGFVESYNNILKSINDKLVEKRNYDYDPLTDAQREEMSDSEIEKWEDLAKSGMLKSDTTLRGITDKLRTALMTGVPDTDGGDDLLLSSIGITTGSYREMGQLHIDEDKLREALVNDREEVIQLFSGQSSLTYSRTMSQTDRAQRDSENGLAWRIHDIIEDNISTIRNDAGYKGALLEKAGRDGDATEYNNQMNTRIKAMDQRIDSVQDYLEKREAYYWRQFSMLEDAMQKMNSQSSWIAQQLGGFGG